MAIGTWGRGPLHMGPDIAAVRQNLRPIVVNGQVPKAVDQNVLTSWGATLGGGYNVWRSGVGITQGREEDYLCLWSGAGCANTRELAQARGLRDGHGT